MPIAEAVPDPLGFLLREEIVAIEAASRPTPSGVVAGDREPPRRCRYATLMLSSTSHLVLRGSVLGSVM